MLNKHTRGRNTERHVFLFDALIVLCKQNLRRASVSGPMGEFKLKEKFNIRKISVRDKEDCEGTWTWILFLAKLKFSMIFTYAKSCLI